MKLQAWKLAVGWANSLMAPGDCLTGVDGLALGRAAVVVMIVYSKLV